MNEDIYLELALTLVADPAASSERWERELFHEIRAELNPENRQNLLIRAYRVAVRRQREEEREERRQREEEQQRRDEGQERREEEQREEERQTLLGNLRELFEQAAYSFYQGRCTEYISPDEYETEKTNYVRSWVMGQECLFSQIARRIGAVEGHVQVIARA